MDSVSVEVLLAFSMECHLVTGLACDLRFFHGCFCQTLHVQLAVPWLTTLFGARHGSSEMTDEVNPPPLIPIHRRGCLAEGRIFNLIETFNFAERNRQHSHVAALT